MTPEEKELYDRLQLERDKNIALKFQNLEEKMDEVIKLLKENSSKYDENKERIQKVEDRQKNCSIHIVKAELSRLRKETSPTRYFGKTSRGYWVTHIMVQFLVMVLTFFILVLFGKEGILKILTFL